MPCEDLRLDQPGQWLLRVAICRPESRNALRTQTLAELAEVLSQAERDPEVRCVILTGNENFCAGADVREIAEKTAVDVLFDERQGHWRVIRSFSKPLVASVNGYCLGGGHELALCCDVIVAGEGAHFGQPEIKLGLIPGAGGTQRMALAMGSARALRYLLTGDLIPAREALAAGLISEVVADHETENRALQIAGAIAGKSPVAARLLKEAVRQANEPLLSAGLAFERKAFTVLFATEDRQEGVAAFLEKRPSEFRGR